MASKTKKAKKEAKAPEIKEPRQFNEKEVAELQELTRVANNFSFVATQIAGNTALVPDGKKVGEQFDAIGRLLQNTKQHWISQKLAECGWPTDIKVSIDMRTGIIVPEGMLTEAIKASKKTK